jgi:hypothetical protein
MSGESPAGVEAQPSLMEVVRRHASGAAFGRPLVQNNLRAVFVEAMVDLALPDSWRWSAPAIPRPGGAHGYKGHAALGAEPKVSSV